MVDRPRGQFHPTHPIKKIRFKIMKKRKNNKCILI